MLTQRDIAEHLDLDQSAVSRFLADLGLEWRSASLDSIRRAYLRRLRSAVEGQRSDSGGDLVAERVSTERVDRELKQLALDEKRAQLVNAAQLAAALDALVTAYAAVLLASDDALHAALETRYGVVVDLAVLNRYSHDALAQFGRLYFAQSLPVAAAPAQPSTPSA